MNPKSTLIPLVLLGIIAIFVIFYLLNKRVIKWAAGKEISTDGALTEPEKQKTASSLANLFIRDDRYKVWGIIIGGTTLLIIWIANYLNLI